MTVLNTSLHQSARWEGLMKEIQLVTKRIPAPAASPNHTQARVIEPLAGEEQLAALLEITRSLTAEMDIDRLLWLIVDTTSELLGADRTTIYLVDEQHRELWSKIAQDSEIREIRLPIGEGLAGYVAQTGETLNIADAYSSPYFNPEIDRMTGYYTRSILTMPMHNRQGRVVGVIQALNKIDGPFTVRDESLLAALASSAAIAVENSQLHLELKLMFDSFISTLAATIDARDPQTAGHSERVTTYALILARELNLPPDRREALRIAALLHDIGKIGVPTAILTKPGRLTREEVQIMQRHVEHTRDILDKIHFSAEMADVPKIAGQHHERVDGSGYPDGVSADDLSLESKILAVADVFESLTHTRYYREALSYEEAFAWIAQHKGAWFDPQVVDALERVLSSDDFLALQEP